MHESGPADGWVALLDQLVEDDTIPNQTVRDIRANVSGYDSVSTAALTASAERNITMSVRIIRSGLSPRPEDLDEADTLAAERYEQSVPIGSVLAGFRACLTIILHRLLENAPRAGIPTEQVLTSSTLLWDLGDAFSARAVVVYREKEIAQALADNTDRSAWISNALAGNLDTAELVRGAALYNVPTTQPLRAIAIHPGPDSIARDRQRLTDWAATAGVQVLTTVRTAALVGIMIGTPNTSSPSPDFTIGTGTAVLLKELPASFETASMALHAAERISMTGSVDLERLSWRRAIEASPETTELLVSQYIAPLNDAGTFRTHLLEAVDAYLTHRLNIPRAASSIPVHVNTLRYRLQRFSRLTGADLGEVNTIIELSWVLAACNGRSTGSPKTTSNDAIS